MNLQDRIYILDGATGTALQQFRLTEADFRGEEFARHPIPLKGNNDVLNITRPDVIRQVHQNVQCKRHITNRIRMHGMGRTL